MRVSDLARKLKIRTEELRPQLADFGIDEKVIEITREKANDIASKWSRKQESDKQELMGMFFDEDEEDTQDEDILVDEEDTEEDEEDTDIDSSEETDKNHDNETEKESKSEEVKKDSETKDSQKPKLEQRNRERGGRRSRDRRNKDKREVAKSPINTEAQEAARARWARAKKASEKLITRKVKKMERDKMRRISRDQERLEEVLHDTSQQAASVKGQVKIGDTISVRELAEKMGVSPIRIVGELLKNGVISNLNQIIDFDTAAIVAEAFSCKIVRDTSAVSGKEILKGNIAKLLEDDPANLAERPPIIAVMGHVDHGKTTLLDTLRKTNVVEGESGGITQHIGAYQVEINQRKITFLDTPGHEAFTTMRARGARATDIAIIVVAAEEGVKPQTIEAINHARAAKIPIIIAITKIDKAGANIDKVKGELAEHDLQASDWGGKTEIVPISAPNNKGIEELLEIILLTNDLEPVKANPNREAVGTVIESRLDKSLGPVATVLVNTGTLNVGDHFVIGPVIGKVKKMFDWNQKIVKSVPPGMPILIAGLSELPQTGVGEILQVLPNADAAKKKAIEMQRILYAVQRAKSSGMSQIIGRINAGDIKELKIVLKTDVEGSLEAIQENIAKIGGENAKAKIIHAGVGNVSETDVLMASAADNFLIAFHTKIPPAAAKLADREGVTIRQHTIIYKLLEEIEKLLGGLLDPEEIETDLGELEVKGIFFTKGKEQTVGGLVKTGKMVNGSSVRILRDGQVIDEGRIASLKRDQTNSHEVKEGYECGLKIMLKRTKIQEGDVIQAWRVEKVERKI
jgi:translation initiation factor IF-2